MKQNVALALVSSLLLAPALSSAGTLQGAYVTFTLNSGSGSASPAGYLTVGCAATAGGVQTTASYSCDATVTLTVKYLGSATEQPPSNVTVACTRYMDGNVGFGYLGHNPPSGSGSSSYRGFAPDAYGYPAQGISDTLPTQSQGTTGSGFNTAQHVDIPTINYSTPSTNWTYVDDGKGTNTGVYTYTFLLNHPNSTASANCSVNWKGSNTHASWSYTIDPNSVTVS